MKNKILIPFILLVSAICFSQQKVTWKDLSKVKFTDKYMPAYDQAFLHPEFSSSVKALEKKQITITGYFLSIDPKGEIFILSKGPMSACFFCGIGGPETAMELRFKTKPNFKTDDIITVTGILNLNDTDIEHFNYILTECKAIAAK